MKSIYLTVGFLLLIPFSGCTQDHEPSGGIVTNGLTAEQIAEIEAAAKFSACGTKCSELADKPDSDLDIN